MCTPLIHHHPLLALHHQQKCARPTHASHTPSSVHAMFVGGGPLKASCGFTRLDSHVSSQSQSQAHNSNTNDKGSMRAFHSADSKPPLSSHVHSKPRIYQARRSCTAYKQPPTAGAKAAQLLHATIMVHTAVHHKRRHGIGAVPLCRQVIGAVPFCTSASRCPHCCCCS